MVDFDLVKLAAVVLCMSIPIVAIVLSIVYAMRKQKWEAETRRLVIENHIEAEMARLLLQGQAARPASPVSTLRKACVLIGGGLAALVAWLLGLWKLSSDGSTILCGFIVALGCGIGLLVAFLAELRMRKQAQPSAPEEPDQEAM